MGTCNVSSCCQSSVMQVRAWFAQREVRYYILRSIYNLWHTSTAWLTTCASISARALHDAKSPPKAHSTSVHGGGWCIHMPTKNGACRIILEVLEPVTLCLCAESPDIIDLHMSRSGVVKYRPCKSDRRHTLAESRNPLKETNPSPL